jgi:hypothetical protein
MKTLVDAPAVADRRRLTENPMKGATDASLERMLSEIDAMTEDNA